MTYKNGDTYEGQLVNGQIHGFGKCIYANKDVYMGYFENGKRHGYGVYTSSDGDGLEGEWENGKFIRRTITNSIENPR